jgi:UDPglucose 6-dehydrogenase
MHEAKQALKDVQFCDNAYDTLQGADALTLLTEWNEFRALDMVRVKASLKSPIVVDLRNIWSPEEMASLGFHYSSIGRPTLKPR